VTRQSDQPVYEARYTDQGKGAILESWYQTQAWVEAAADPRNQYWSENERVSLSQHRLVQQHAVLVALEEAVRQTFEEIGGRQLYNIQLVSSTQ
jgi:hypothetical protein